MLDPAAVRAHFPALDPLNHGGTAPLYFDNPAGTQIAAEAMSRMQDYLVHRNANHGGASRASRESDAMVRDTRAALADFLGAARPEEISFGQNMTSLTLHVSRCLSAELSAGDEIVLTRLDHDANVSPWLLMARDRGCTVRWVDFDTQDCTWCADELRGRSRSARSSLPWEWRPTPRAPSIRLPPRHGSRMMPARCSSSTRCTTPRTVPIDVSAIGCDLLACSAYKFFGPHVGVLWGRYALMDRLSAYKVRPAGDAPPDKWETGTQSFESIAGVGGAIEYLEWLGRRFGSAAASANRKAALKAGMDAIREYEAGLSRAMRDGLSSIKGLRIHGITDSHRMDSRAPTYSFTLDGWKPRRICEELDKAGIYASDGNYYALEVTTRLGLEAEGGMVRVGAAHYNTLEEVETLVEKLREIAGGAMDA